MPTESNSNSELSPEQTIYPTQADTTETFPFTLDGTVATGERQLILNAPYHGRIASFNVISSAGTGTFTVKIQNVNVTGLVSKTVSTTEADYVPTDLNLFEVDQDISIDFTATAGLSNVTINISVLRETGQATTISSTTPSSPDSIAASALEILSVALPQGYLLVDVTFGTAKLDENDAPTENYAVTPQVPENLSGEDPVDRIGIPTVIDKRSTGMTLLLNAAPTSDNSIFRCTVATAAASSLVVAAGSTSGSGPGGVITTTNLPLRGDNAGNAIAIAQQTGDVATGLQTLNFFSSSPTYDADKLTLTDVTTNNASVSKHGFLKKLSGTATEFMNGAGNWTAPIGDANIALATFWSGKGQLAVGTGTHTASPLGPGANSKVLITNSALVTGLDWIFLTDASIATANKDGTTSTPSMRTLGTGATQAAAGNDARIVGSLQAANALSEINSLGNFDDVRINLNFGTIVYENLPDGGPVGLSAAQTLVNKYIDADNNTIVNLTSANFKDSDTVMELTDPNADRGLMWDDSLGEFAWATGLTYTVNAITGINGTTAAGNAAAGDLGEVVSSLVVVGSPVSLASTGTVYNVTSISLTAGDWDVEGNVNFTANAATTTALQAAIHTTTAALPTDGSEVYSGLQTITTSYIDSITLPRKRVNVSGTTIVYLVAKATFSAGTIGGFGGITARRVR